MAKGKRNDTETYDTILYRVHVDLPQKPVPERIVYMYVFSITVDIIMEDSIN